MTETSVSTNRSTTTNREAAAPKLLAFIAMLYIGSLSIGYFYYVFPFLLIHYLLGTLLLAIAFAIFLTFELVDFGPLKIPWKWWIMLIFGVVLVLIAYFFDPVPIPYFVEYEYLPGILLLIAAIIDFVMQKKPYKASKMLALVGAGFTVYECFVLFLSGSPILIVNAVFGLILIILLIILIFDFVDLKILDFSWWVLLIIGFVVFTWISPNAAGYPVLGYGGIILLIAFLLNLKDY